MEILRDITCSGSLLMARTEEQDGEEVESLCLGFSVVNRDERELEQCLHSNVP